MTLTHDSSSSRLCRTSNLKTQFSLIQLFQSNGQITFTAIGSHMMMKVGGFRSTTTTVNLEIQIQSQWIFLHNKLIQQYIHKHNNNNKPIRFFCTSIFSKTTTTNHKLNNNNKKQQLK
jgi:hypothetical protein